MKRNKENDHTENYADWDVFLHAVGERFSILEGLRRAALDILVRTNNHSAIGTSNQTATSADH